MSKKIKMFKLDIRTNDFLYYISENKGQMKPIRMCHEHKYNNCSNFESHIVMINCE